MRYKMSKIFIAFLTFILLCSNVYGAETAVIGEAELGMSIAEFYKGSPTVFSTVTKVTNSSDVTYTTVTTRSGRESYDDFGNIQVVSRCRFPEETVYRHIGLKPEALGEVKLKFKLKLDDVRNKNLKVVFSYAQDATGNTLSANYLNDEYRYAFCDENGNEYISIEAFIAETTEWQIVEATLDLSTFIKAKNKNEMIDADWSKAAAIEIASLKADNVFSIDEDVTSAEISYEGIELEFSANNYCTVTIDVTDSVGESVTALQSGATIIPTVKFDNKKTNDETVLVMFTVYKDNLMVKLITKFITANYENSDTIPLGAYTLPADITGYEVYMHIWADFSEMQAYSEQVHIR